MRTLRRRSTVQSESSVASSLEVWGTELLNTGCFGPGMTGVGVWSLLLAANWMCFQWVMPRLFFGTNSGNKLYGQNF